MKALLVGAGGLGAPAALALADRGGVALEIWDPDRVELSNLHRQILYTEADLGRPKAEVAAEHLQRRYPALQVAARVAAFGTEHAAALARFDLVLDGTDRFEVKLAIHDLALDAGVPYVFAGVVGSEGQVLGVRPGAGACLRCLFDEAPPPGAAPTCAELGILGPIAGMVAAQQARVAVALITDAAEGGPGLGAPGRLWIYDGLRDRARTISIPQMADCRGCGARRAERGRWAAIPASAAVEAAPELDLTGWACPRTFIETRKRLEALPAGGHLWIRLSSDESARNVPASCLAAGHKVLAQRVEGRHHRILLERAGGE